MTADLTQRFPAGPDSTAEQVLAEVTAEPVDGRLGVGDERVREFLTRLSRRLLAPALARRYPELAALGFFLRPSELRTTLERLQDPPGTLRFPRGLAFHVPPANVDTIFVYSWALSALAGNPNIVRLSPRSAGAADAILEALAECVQDAHPAILQTQRIVTYGHDDSITAAFSAACELRVIWGGDASVAAIRRHPLSPATRDLTFPDRSSFAVFSADGYLAAPEAARDQAAARFYNDNYWFDQAACASARAVYWVGTDTAAARADFHDRLNQVVDTQAPLVDSAMAVEKRVATYGLAIAGDASAVRFHGNAVATVDLTKPERIPRRWLGLGTFPEASVASLSELVPIVRRQDQTVTHFGFRADELTRFAQDIGGRGVDRIVPVGEALSFAPTWDGYDLVRELTRLTTVSA